MLQSNMRLKLLIAVALVLFLASCAVSERVSDGYQPGDVTQGMADNYRRYCAPQYVFIRFLGRWMLRLIAYPVPNLCPQNTKAN